MLIYDKTRPELPVSNALFAYDMLADIVTLAERDAAAVQMAYWILRFSDIDMSDDTVDLPDLAFPVCGQICCIGGWVNVFTGAGYSGKAARVALGLSPEQSHELFYGDTCNDADQGSVSHAARAIAHVKAFMAKYSTQLRATTVVRQ